MIKKIRYFMARDTRLIADNLTKVIIDEDTLVITYTMFRQNLDDKTINAIKYHKSKKIMFISDKLERYNVNVYNSFIEWANEKGIKYYSIGKVGNEHERTN